MTNKIMHGTVKTLVANRFYGFIKCDEVEYFFHRSDFLGDWKQLEQMSYRKQNIPVEFELGNSTKGPRAANVKLVES